MCSKPVEPRGAAPGPAAPKRVWSITRRLTLLYVASTAALLLLAGGFLYSTLDRSLDLSRRGLIANKIGVLELLLRQQPEKADALASEVEHEASASHLLQYYIRILDEHGQVWLETSGMKELLPVALFPKPQAATEALDDIKPEPVGRRTFLLMSVHEAIGATGRAQGTLQIGLDITSRVALMADYRNKLLTVLGLGLVFATGAGVLVARKGMRPLVEITKTAQRTTASQLHERIGGSRWPAELHELAGAFDAMLDRLEDSFARLSRFDADLAHALRSPINNLRGEAEVALSRSRTPEEYQQTLTSSLEEYERLSRMIDGLLFLARADDPKMAMQWVRFDARKQLDAVREFYEALAAEQQVDVTCEGDAWLTGDAMLFRRAVSNLLANALRHTPPHGSIRISLCTLAEQGVEVRVGDSGCGIAPEHLPRIFDRFYRVGHSDSQVPGGIGLGLTIVQSIMRLHGGTVQVQSELGRGSLFTLRFPADSAAGVSGKMTEM